MDALWACSFCPRLDNVTRREDDEQNPDDRAGADNDNSKEATVELGQDSPKSMPMAPS
jgi:hypothetical protein